MSSIKKPALLNLVRHYWGIWKDYPRERFKLALGAVLYPKATTKWLSYLQASPDLQHQAQRFPKLVTRIYRPYALRSLNCHGRVNLMLQHHEALRLSGLHTLVKASCDLPLVIHTWFASNDNYVALQLLSLRDGHREGDLSFQLCWNSEVIFSITLVLRVDRRNWQLLITRLQGSQTGSAQEMIRNATKALHGLRPADLLLQMARHLAGFLKCTEVAMVSNQHRVALNPVRRRQIKFDGDKFWMEKGARKNSDGLYVLPSEVEIRSDFSDIPSNKRAQAKRRAEVLRQALDALNAALNSFNKRRD